MMFVLLGIFFYMLVKKNTFFKLNQCNSGFDERPVNDTVVLDMRRARMNNDKWKLLQQLNSPKIADLEKVKLIEMSKMLDELNNHVIKAPSLLKGINNDFLEKAVDNEDV